MTKVIVILLSFTVFSSSALARGYSPCVNGVVKATQETLNAYLENRISLDHANAIIGTQVLAIQTCYPSSKQNVVDKVGSCCEEIHSLLEAEVQTKRALAESRISHGQATMILKSQATEIRRLQIQGYCF